MHDIMDMKKVIVCAVMGLFALAVSAQSSKNKAQADDKDEQARLEIYTQRAETYADQFELSPETGAKFIDLFIEWQTNRLNIMDKYGVAQKAGADVNFKKISAEEAQKMLDEDFERLAKQAEIDKEYYNKFKELITPGHAAQVVLQTRNNAAGMMSQIRGAINGMRGMNRMGGMGMPF